MWYCCCVDSGGGEAVAVGSVVRVAFAMAVVVAAVAAAAVAAVAVAAAVAAVAGVE